MDEEKKLPFALAAEFAHTKESPPSLGIDSSLNTAGPALAPASCGDGNDDPAVNAAAEKRLLRKLDLNILPMLFILYFFSFLDRSNIGNAKIQGMTEDLDLDVGNRYNLALVIFFIPYILLEVPSNMILRHSRPSLYLPGLVFFWGIINMSMGFVHSHHSLTILRFLLGTFESGLLPGALYYSSLFYKRYEFHRRFAIIASANGVATTVSGLLAYAIGHMDGINGYKGWRWIFIIEGGTTSVVALLSHFFMADFPEQATFLTPAERHLLSSRLLLDGAQPAMNNLDAKAALAIARDWKIWLSGFIQIGGLATAYSFSFFLPTILAQLGWTASSAQLHTMPVHLVSLMSLLSLAWASDRARHRYLFLVIPLAVGSSGHCILLFGSGSVSAHVKYGATFLMSISYSGLLLANSWLMNNLSGHYKKAAGSAMALSLANCGGLIASTVFLAREKPSYKTGYSVTLAFIWMSILASTVLELSMWRENKKRDRGERDTRLLGSDSDVQNLGDDHPSFRYAL